MFNGVFPLKPSTVLSPRNFGISRGGRVSVHNIDYGVVILFSDVTRPFTTTLAKDVDTGFYPLPIYDDSAPCQYLSERCKLYVFLLALVCVNVATIELDRGDMQGVALFSPLLNSHPPLADKWLAKLASSSAIIRPPQFAVRSSQFPCYAVPNGSIRLVEALLAKIRHSGHGNAAR